MSHRLPLRLSVGGLTLIACVLPWNQGFAQNLHTEDQKILVGTGAAGDEAGRRCSIDGDLAAVGVPLDDPGGQADAGSVILYRRSGNQWVEETTLTEPVAAAGNRFGWDVTLDGQRLIVGAIANASVFGSAYVYTHVSGAWQLEGTLGVGVTGGFGYGVDLSGDLAIVGHYVAATTGIATLYRYTAAAGWALEWTLRPPDGANSDWFGLTVAVDDSSVTGDCALVASQFHDALGNNAGAAYVFRKKPLGSWYHEQKLTASDGVAGDAFGIDLDLGHDLAVISAWPKDDGFTDSGAAYAFHFNGGSWVEQKLVPSQTQSYGYFGLGVGVDRETAVVGSIGLQGSRGAAFVFRECGGLLYEQHQLRASDPGGQQLGHSCDVSETTVLAGAPKDDELGADAGATYSFEIPALMLSTPPWAVTGGDPLTFASSGGPSGGLAFLYLTDINGIPFFLRLFTGNFNTQGHWSLTTPVSNDPGLPGNTLGFRMFAFAPGNGLTQSNISYVQFQ